MSASSRIKRSKFRPRIGVVRRDVPITIGIIQLFWCSSMLLNIFSTFFRELAVSDSTIILSAQKFSFRISESFCVQIQYSFICLLQQLLHVSG
jgi:hypothetical protein